MSVTNHSGDFLRGHVPLLKERKDLKKKKKRNFVLAYDPLRPHLFALPGKILDKEAVCLFALSSNLTEDTTAFGTQNQ